MTTQYKQQPQQLLDELVDTFQEWYDVDGDIDRTWHPWYDPNIHGTTTTTNMTEQQKQTIMTDEYAKEYNDKKENVEKPKYCDPPCETRPMMGRSWWKSLGYGTPCLCAENAYDEQEKAKMEKEEWWKPAYNSFNEAIVGEFGDESEQAKKYGVGIFSPKEENVEEELKEYNGVMLPKYIDGREVLSYPNAGITQEEEEEEEELIESLYPPHHLSVLVINDEEEEEIEPQYSNPKYQYDGWENDGDHFLKRKVRCLECKELTNQPWRFNKHPDLNYNIKSWICKKPTCIQKHDEFNQENRPEHKTKVCSGRVNF